MGAERLDQLFFDLIHGVFFTDVNCDISTELSGDFQPLCIQVRRNHLTAAFLLNGLNAANIEAM